MSDRYVVINHEEQYSIWPLGKATPSGWKVLHKSGSKEACLDFIEEVWTDRPPSNVRRAAEELYRKIGR